MPAAATELRRPVEHESEDQLAVMLGEPQVRRAGAADGPDLGQSARRLAHPSLLGFSPVERTPRLGGLMEKKILPAEQPKLTLPVGKQQVMVGEGLVKRRRRDFNDLEPARAF